MATIQYTVKKGDSLSAIGKTYGLNYAQSVGGSISGFKSGNPSLIYPGEVLTINTNASGGGQSTNGTPTGTYNQASNNAFGNLADIQNFTNQAQNIFSQSAPSMDVPQVRSLSDISADVKNMLPTNNAPATPNLLQTYQGLVGDNNIQGLETEINDLKAQEDEILAQLRVNTSAERGKPVATNVIAGRISEETRQAQESLDFVQRQKARKVDELSMRYKTIETIMNFTQKDYENAKSSYDSEFNNAMKMIDLARGIQETEINQKNRAEDLILKQQDSARANAQILINAVTSGNMSTANLPAETKLQLQKLELQSGLPVGFFSSLQMSPKDQILHINEKTGEVLMSDGNGGFKNVKGMITPSGSGSESQASITRESQSKVAQYLDLKKNSYGHVDPTTWNSAKSAWLSDGLDIGDFNKAFISYTDPNRGDFESAYGIKRSDRSSAGVTQVIF